MWTAIKWGTTMYHRLWYKQTKKYFPKQAVIKITLKTAIQHVKKFSFILQYLPVENSDLTVPP